MLVITRKSQERIVIGEDVEIVVLSVQGRRVKLGVRADADKRIQRFDGEGGGVSSKRVAELIR